MAVQEKRRHSRIISNMPLHCMMRGQAKYANTSINDISLGGLSFTYDNFIAPHTYLILEFSIRQQILCTVGRIAWTNSMPYAQRYRCGVEFTEINQENRLCLKDYVSLRQPI